MPAGRPNLAAEEAAQRGDRAAAQPWPVARDLIRRPSQLCGLAVPGKLLVVPVSERAELAPRRKRGLAYYRPRKSFLTRLRMPVDRVPARIRAADSS